MSRFVSRIFVGRRLVSLCLVIILSECLCKLTNLTFMNFNTFLLYNLSDTTFVENPDRLEWWLGYIEKLQESFSFSHRCSLRIRTLDHTSDFLNFFIVHPPGTSSMCRVICIEFLFDIFHLLGVE